MLIYFYTEDGTPMNLTTKEYEICIANLTLLTQALGADLADLDELIQLDINKTPISTQKVSHLMIRKRPKSVQEALEVRVAVVGNVDAGKVKDNIQKKRHKLW